jgi:G:T-mismatch repair DNA endonuclease (very short patch repair protein)
VLSGGVPKGGVGVIVWTVNRQRRFGVAEAHLFNLPHAGMPDRHPNCPKASAPSSPYWAAKFASNIRRDRRVEKELQSLGWKVIVIWECETKKPKALKGAISKRIPRCKVH